MWLQLKGFPTGLKKTSGKKITAWVRHPPQNYSSCYKAMAEALLQRNWAQSLMHAEIVPDLCLEVTRKEGKTQQKPTNP